ncbi:DUF6894 family protein [Sphingomonas sp. SRS2]|uniref:DUF6894 family protein n=1 Tax=Sphingomonas sp. SRS2 TaxID=133190 RepID=UPI0006184926|nr:hypothetical protein [Sphingomonas sp. SRS2]KKC24380.1 hypothetical protein WP12_19695 [Sphingomonas sp. SRS2]
MPHFYLHLINGSGITRDQEGIELPDVDAARVEALAAIRSILKEELNNGQLDLGGRVAIEDGQGNFLCDVMFAEAVDISSNGVG